MPVTAALQTRAKRRWRALLSVAPVLLLLSGSAPATALTPATSAKTTAFSGRIVSSTGRYAHLRGAVRLLLRGMTTATGRAFTLSLSGPPCASQAIRSPSRCVTLGGTVTGRVGQAPRIPDIGAQFALAGAGRISPLGSVSATGATSGLGFISHGRFPLTLTLRNAAGAVKIVAQGPVSAGFSEPF